MEKIEISFENIKDYLEYADKQGAKFEEYRSIPGDYLVDRTIYVKCFCEDVKWVLKPRE